MEQEWFYAEDETSVGPVSSEALIGALRRSAEPGKTLVWRAGLATWQQAADIPELAGRIGKPVVDGVVTPDAARDRWTDAGSGPEPWDEDAAARRHWPRIAVAVALAAAIVGGATYASRVLSRGGESEARVVLPGGARPPSQPARPDPDVLLAQLAEKATQAAAATDAISLKLWASIEPPTMQSPPDVATASRGDLERYLGDLKTAEANSVAVRQQYAALLDAERGLIEDAARASGLDEGRWSDLLAAVSERQRASLELAGKMLQARADLYRAMQATQSIVIGDFGKYKVDAAGQMRFSSRAVTERATAASGRVSAANQALDRIELQMVEARQTVKPTAEPAWKAMVVKEQGGMQGFQIGGASR